MRILVFFISFLNVLDMGNNMFVYFPHYGVKYIESKS